ncbi:MAG: hypothetical protein ACI9H6_000733 [Patiriisocius sp.]|jgi:hypothetical protein
MTGGSSALSSSTQKSSVAFNLREELSVLKLLKRIHHSTLTVDTKNGLRDTVFSFRTVPGAQMTDALKEMFASHGFDIVAGNEQSSVSAEAPMEELAEVFTPEAVPATQPLTNRRGTSRGKPNFAPASVTTEAVSSTPIATPEVAVVSEPIIEAPEPVEPVISTPVEVVPEPAASVIPVPAPVEVPAEVVPAAESVLDRIKKIKKEVNELVGNPVNLIDVNNEVGREYMTALLDAMKKNNGGTPQEVAVAMTRLESAFASVQVTVSTASTPTTMPDAAVDATIEAEAPTPVTPEPVIPAVPSFTSVHDTHAQAPEVVETPEPTAEPVVTPVPEVEVASPVVAPIPEVAVPEPVAPEIVTPEPVIPVEPVVSEAPSVEAAPSGIMSVAKEKQIADLLTSQKQEAAVTDKQRSDAEIAGLDPLMTPDVTNGLHQLVSEWELFKSSGLFGTGPSGAEHPLYKKLSVLTMSAIVAGRFDEATPQIKRSITDYMNGWRYEEGILHEHGETFENYLRRVIKHILEKRFTDTPVKPL